jgi:hypothetical protein
MGGRTRPIQTTTRSSSIELNRRHDQVQFKFKATLRKTILRWSPGSEMNGGVILACRVPGFVVRHKMLTEWTQKTQVLKDVAPEDIHSLQANPCELCLMVSTGAKRSCSFRRPPKCSCPSALALDNVKTQQTRETLEVRTYCGIVIDVRQLGT